MRSIFLIFYGRFPSEKAASLFATKSCEAFAGAGEKVTLLVPRRTGREKTDLYQYYHVQKNFKVVFLPVLDFLSLPFFQRYTFLVGYLTFSISCLLYLFVKAKKEDLIYSNESLPLFFASSYFPNTFYEVHDFPERKLSFYRVLMHRMRYLLVTNTWKVENIVHAFSLPSKKILCERNAVDVKEFDIALTKEEARVKLGLSTGDNIVVYTGHLYSWKGVDTLAEAAKLLPITTRVIFVGGTEGDVQRFKNVYGGVKNIVIMGHRDHKEIPLWQKAADVLVLPNTARENISKYYTSPMKLFEYMASRRPIVASNIPSISEMLNDTNAALVTPDNPKGLAEGIKKILQSKDQGVSLAERAYQDVLDHSWESRARRILQFLGKNTP